MVACFRAQVLLQRHRHSIGPYLLQVLSSLPETLDPRKYAQLLPRGSGGLAGWLTD
jgi:hypothetical protein